MLDEVVHFKSKYCLFNLNLVTQSFLISILRKVQECLPTMMLILEYTYNGIYIGVCDVYADTICIERKAWLKYCTLLFLFSRFILNMKLTAKCLL